MIYLWSLIGPFCLFLVLRLFPLGILLEEILKGSLTFWLVKSSKKALIWTAMGIGVAYGFSELVLFSFKYWSAGVYLASVWRLLLTLPMHGATTMIWFVGFKKKKAWLGALAALALHGLFNYLVGGSLFW